MPNTKIIVRLYTTCGIVSIILLLLGIAIFKGHTLLLNILIPSSIISFLTASKYHKGFKIFDDDTIDAKFALLTLTALPYTFLVILIKSFEFNYLLYFILSFIFIVIYISLYFLFLKKK